MRQLDRVSRISDRGLLIKFHPLPRVVARPVPHRSSTSSVVNLFSSKQESFGFRSGTSGAMMARTLMLSELNLVLARTGPQATVAEVGVAIIDENILGKPTTSSRIKTYRHLVELYGMDPSRALYRTLRRLFTLDPSALPGLALVCGYCRDPQLRASFTLVKSLKQGEHLSRSRMEEWLEASFPNRFSAALKQSLAQNVNAAWTASGHLEGRSKKTRTLPHPRPIAVAFALFAAYLAGLRGQRLLQSDFGELVCPDPKLIPAQLSLAAARGLLRYKHAGGIVELDFSPLLTPEELALADVTD